MLNQDRWASLRREVEQLFGYPPGTTDPHTTPDQAINLALLEDIHRLNQSFITLAIKEWDLTGQGCFANFIKGYIFHCWHRLARLN